MIEIKKTDDIVAQRIKEAINSEGYQSQKEFCDSFSPRLTESLLSDIFNGKRRTVENLKMLADKFSCSLDYLVGISPVKSQDPDLQAFCKMTGLSEASVYALSQDYNDDELEVINVLLNSGPYSKDLFSKLLYYFNVNKYGSDYAYMFCEEDMVAENGRMMFVLPSVENNSRVPMANYEQSCLGVVSNTIKAIKEQSPFEIRTLEREIIKVKELIKTSPSEGFKDMCRKYIEYYESRIEDIKRSKPDIAFPQLFKEEKNGKK